ncbi:MAG: hypothetical protein ACR2MO_03300 [Acidimicrobiales bacterium]
MPDPAKPHVVVVIGTDGEAVGREVRRRRAAGERIAGFVGDDEALATAMAEEMLGGCDEMAAPPGDAEAFWPREGPESGR